MKYKLTVKNLGGIFAVPNEVVDQHIALAGSFSIRALLVVLRYGADNITLEEVAKKLKVSKADTKDALNYWVQSGFLEAVDVAKKTKEKEETPPKKVEVNTSVPSKPTPDEVAKRTLEDDGVAYLLNEAQMVLSKLITPSEAATLIYMYDYMGLPIDVIVMLLNFCRKKDLKTMRQIEKMANVWAELEIFDHEKAEDYIKKVGRAERMKDKVAALFEITELSQRESEFVNRWVIDFEYKYDIINCACEIASQSKKRTFPYVNAILQNWHEQGFTTVAQCRGRKNSAQNTSTSLDINKIDNIAKKKLVYKKKGAK